MTNAEVLADILEIDYGYTIVDVGHDYVILSQSGIYLVDVQKDIQDIMHKYVDLEMVRYEVYQDPQGIAVELI